MQAALHTTSWQAIARAAAANSEVMALASERLAQARLECDEGESIDELDLHWTKVWVRWSANDFGAVTITGVDITGVDGKTETVDSDCFSERVIGGWKRELEDRIREERAGASHD